MNLLSWVLAVHVANQISKRNCGSKVIDRQSTAQNTPQITMIGQLPKQINHVEVRQKYYILIVLIIWVT